MKKFDKYIIVSDMDGTFLGEKSALVPKNMDAIHYFNENGGLFTLATGRDKPVLKYIFPNAEDFITGPAILCNGAYLYNFQTNVLEKELRIDKEKTLLLIDHLEEKFPHIGYRISTDRYFISNHCTEDLMSKMQRYLPIFRIGDLKEHLDIPWHKIVFSGTAEEMPALSQYCKSIHFDGFNQTTSSNTLHEFMPVGVSKGQKIKDLREFYPERTIVCVGDYDNDLEMLREADIAACPENANDAVKAISTIQLCHHRDGCIADLIYKLESSIND